MPADRRLFFLTLPILYYFRQSPRVRKEKEMKIASRFVLLLVPVAAMLFAVEARASNAPGPATPGLPMVYPALEGLSNTFYGSGAGNATLQSSDAQFDTFIGKDAGTLGTTGGYSN